MPKTFIKKTAGWTEIKSIFVKKTTGWAEVKNVFLKKTTGWVKVFTKLSLPDTTTAPSIRATNTGTGTIYDGPVATTPQYLNADLFGKDGVYTNYTSIFGRKFTRGSSSSALTRTTIVNDDRFTSAGGVTTAMRTACDEQYLFYELTVQNGSASNEIYPISPAIKMIKNYPNTISFGWNEAEEVGTQLAFNYSLENYYYNSVEPGSSYIRWWRSTDTNPGGTLIKQETITATTTGTPSSTSRSGTSYYTPTSTDLGYYIVAEIIAVSSYTRHNGYTDNYSLGSFPTDGVIGSALTFYNVEVKDEYGRNGLDNRDRWPTDTINQFTGQLSGYDSNTVIRIRYRIYNFDTGLYWKPSTQTQTTASNAWDSWNSDGTGNGYISDVSVSGGVATFYDYFTLPVFFNGGGSGPTWWLEVELSAVRGGPRVYYINPYETFYISKAIDSTISVSPTTISPGSSTTISGTLNGFPATPSTNGYPRQYKVDYGDGTDSGWLPVGEYAYGTLNPTYSLSKTYNTAGTYTVSIDTIPYYEIEQATVTVATTPNAFTYTLTNESSVTAPSTPSQSRVSSSSNLVLVDFATSKPSDTESYTLNISGAGSAAYVGNSNTAVNQTITSVNGYDSNGNSSASGSYEWVTAIDSGATTAKSIDFYVTSTGKRTLNANVSTTTNASSWAINFTWSGASSSSVTYYSNGSGTLSASTGATVTVYTNSMPVKIADITGTNNPTVTINSITAYGSTNQTGQTRAGTSGTTTSLSSISRPTQTSGTSSATYIYYSTDPQAFTINNVTKTDSSATSTPTIDTISYDEATKKVSYTYSATNAARFKNIAYGTAFSTDGSQASPAKGPFYTTSTSDFWYYDEAGSVTVGVAATNALAKANVTWGSSTNAGSYKVSYTLAGTAYTSAAQTGTSFSVNTYSGGTQQEFILTGVTAYKAADGTGTSKAGTLPTTTSVTPTETFSGYGTRSINVTMPFVTPYWNGTLPKWNSTAPSNFQRTSTTIRWGWGNGTFSFAGSVGTSKGWNWEVRNSASGSGTLWGSSYWPYTTTNDTRVQVNSVSYPYLIYSGGSSPDVSYSASSRYGRVNPYQFGTDSVEYNKDINGNRVWTAFL